MFLTIVYFSFFPFMGIHKCCYRDWFIQFKYFMFYYHRCYFITWTNKSLLSLSLSNRVYNFVVELVLVVVVLVMSELRFYRWWVPAMQQLQTVRLHHWWRVNEHLYVMLDIPVQPLTIPASCRWPLCSSRSLTRCT